MCAWFWLVLVETPLIKHISNTIVSVLTVFPKFARLTVGGDTFTTEVGSTLFLTNVPWRCSKALTNNTY